MESGCPPKCQSMGLFSKGRISSLSSFSERRSVTHTAIFCFNPKRAAALPDFPKPITSIFFFSPPIKLPQLQCRQTHKRQDNCHNPKTHCHFCFCPSF